MELLRMTLTAAVFWPMGAAILGYIAGRYDKHLRDILVWIFLGLECIPAGALFLAAYRGIPVDVSLPGICGMGMHFTLDGFRAIFVVLSAFLWMMSTLLAVEYMHHERNRNRYYLFLLLTQGAAMGVFLSADLYTTFIFFEIMSFTSYVWVAQNENREALRAAETYLGIAVIGGMILLMGLLILYHTIGTLDMAELAEATEHAWHGNETTIFAAGIMILLGFGAKAAMFPLHVWMPRAHTVAPAPASALLSGILTKAGLFGILAISSRSFFENGRWGNMILALGMITMTLGAVLAVFAVNLKRTLACSSMSQMGFVLTGIGMASLLGEEGALAARGAVLHMMNHSLFKLILFLCAGVVYMNLEELELNDVRGFGRKKPLLQAVFLSGALGIGGVPLFSGYASKTLLHESILEYMHIAGPMASVYKAAELLFLFCGGLTVSYMIKLYVALFVNRHPERQDAFDAKSGSYAGKASRIALILSAVGIPILGIFPNIFMDGAARMAEGFFLSEPLEHAIHYFSFENLKGGVISILIGILVYTFFIRKVVMVEEEKGCWRYVDRWPGEIDLEEQIYRPLVTKILPDIGYGFASILDGFMDHMWNPLVKLGALAAGALNALMDLLWQPILRVGMAVFRFFEQLPDFLFMLLREFVFNPIHLLTKAEEAEKIRRHREMRNRMAFGRWSTMALSFGFLTSCAGILIMLVWVFTSLLR